MNRLLILTLLIAFGFFGKAQQVNVEVPPYSRFLGELAGSNAEISGTILASGLPADSVWVSVFKESSPNTLQFVKATQTNSNSGYYRIHDLEEGTYYLSAEPMTYSLKKRYSPTYYGDSAIWSLSKACYIQGTVSNKNINLTPIVATTGNEALNGSIKFGTDVPGYNEGDPVINAALLVYNLKNELIALTNSDGSGLYAFSDLPNEEVKIIVNSPGKKSSGYIVNPSTLKNELTFWVTGTRSYGLTNALDIEESLENRATTIFPIPAKSTLTVINENNYSLLSIYDISGSLKKSGSIVIGRNEIDVSSMNKGTYILRLIGEEKTFSQTIIID